MHSLKKKLKKVNFGLSARDLKVITGVLLKYPEVEKTLVFGSRAKGIHSKGSDVDICVRGKKMNSVLASRIHFDLEEETLLPYFFDVINYDDIENSDLKDHIDRRGKIIYRKLQ